MALVSATCGTQQVCFSCSWLSHPAPETFYSPPNSVTQHLWNELRLWLKFTKEEGRWSKLSLNMCTWTNKYTVASICYPPHVKVIQIESVSTVPNIANCLRGKSRVDIIASYIQYSTSISNTIWDAGQLLLIFCHCLFDLKKQPQESAVKVCNQMV